MKFKIGDKVLVQGKYEGVVESVNTNVNVRFLGVLSMPGIFAYASKDVVLIPEETTGWQRISTIPRNPGPVWLVTKSTGYVRFTRTPSHADIATHWMPADVPDPPLVPVVAKKGEVWAHNDLPSRQQTILSEEVGGYIGVRSGADRPEYYLAKSFYARYHKSTRE